MQSVSFSIYFTAFIGVTLISSSTSVPTTMPSSIAVTTAAGNPMVHENDATTSGNSSTTAGMPALNDEPKPEQTTILPTRLPENEANSLSTKPAINHESTTPTTTGASAGTTAKVTGTEGPLGVKPTKAEGSGTSRQHPELWVTSLIFIIVSILA